MEKVQCGVENKNGSMCKLEGLSLEYMIAGLSLPCKRHRTEEDETKLSVLKRVYGSGFRDGTEQAVKEARKREGYLNNRIGVLQSRVAEVEKSNNALYKEKQRRASSTSFRTHTVAGNQIVEVEGYAYEWRGQGKLKVGDEIRLPGNYFSPGGWTGKVSSIGSDYTGSMSSATRRV